jgi:hypothetical protein
MEVITTTLTVFYDGQFWVALVERHEENTVKLARHVFGPEPGSAEIAKWVDEGYAKLHFVTASPKALGKTDKPAINPKRAKREASRALRSTKSISKAHEAMRLIREAEKKQT